MRRRRAAFVLLAASLAAAGCGDADSIHEGEVEDLVLPTAEEREAGDALRAAETFLDAGKPRQAEPLLRRVCELTPRNARGLQLLGQALYDRGAVEEAATYLRRAVEVEPQNQGAHSLLVVALKSRGDLAAAEEACVAWTTSVRDDDEGWYQLGTVLAELGRLPEAAQALRTAASRRTSRADVRSQLGLVLLSMGELEDAETKQRDAIERRQDYGLAWFRLGDVLSRRGPDRIREAVAAYDRALELEPRKTLWHLYLFHLCRTPAAGEAEDLRARGQKAWEQVLRLHGVHQLAEEATGGNGEVGKSSEFALREEVALRPEDPAPRVALARHLHAEGRLEEAADAYRRAIECGAEGWQVRARFGAALLAAGDAAGAEAALREAVRIATAAAAPPAAVSAVPHRLLAWALLVRGRDDDAVAACDAALSLAPDDLLAKKCRALARMHRGELDEGFADVAAAGWLE